MDEKEKKMEFTKSDGEQGLLFLSNPFLLKEKSSGKIKNSIKTKSDDLNFISSLNEESSINEINLSEDLLRSLEFIHDISKKFAQEMNYKNIIHLFFNSIKSIVDIYAGGAVLLAGDNIEGFIYSSISIKSRHKNLLDAMSAKLSLLLDRKIEKEKIEVTLFEIKDDYLFRDTYLSTLYHIPLIVDNQIIGIVTLQLVKDISKFQSKLLHILANQCTTNIAKSFLLIEQEISQIKSILDNFEAEVILISKAGKVILSNKLENSLLAKINGVIKSDNTLYFNDFQLQNILQRITSGYNEYFKKEITTKIDQISTVIEIQISPVQGGIKEEFGALIKLRDLTYRKRAEEQAIQNSKMICIGQLSASVAHEINNPLMSVLGFSDLLLKENLPHNVLRDIAKIKKDALRAKTIVNDLLLFARFQKEDSSTYFNLSESTRITLKILRKQFIFDRINIIEELDNNIPELYANPGKIQQVIINLVQNAHDAIILSGCGKNIKVKTGLSDKKDVILLCVEDDGPGIPDDIKDKVFEPFFTTKEVGKGNGLGLYIANKIVKQYKGDIKIESKPGKGTKIIIELPLVNRGEKKKEEDNNKVELNTLQKSVISAKVLVIDDEATLVELMTRVLKIMGYDVYSASNGIDALEKIKNENFDLITLDIKMPGISGPELYEEIKKRKPELISKIIFLTGDTVSEDIENFLESSGNLYLTKPFDIDIFSRCVEKMLSSNSQTCK